MEKAISTIENNGKWRFVGNVPAELAYITVSGDTPTAQDFRNAQIAGPRIAGLKTRTWDTEEDALQAAEIYNSGA